MKLIDNWRLAYRMFSVQALMFIASLQMILLALPGDTLDAQIPMLAPFTWGDLNALLTVTVAVLGAIGRVIDQGHIVNPP